MWKLKRAGTQIARGTVVMALMALASCATSRFGIASAQYDPAGGGYVESGGGGYVGANVDVGVFHESLSPYGDWVYVNHFGRVWRPYRAIVGVDFRPYLSGGHWVYTDYGWSFESDYDWGWAPFHYGRWFMDPYYGWVWLPDTVWAPAWVDWRFGGGYVGWAPLAPVGFSASFGYYRPVWCFVPTAHFVVHDVYRHVVPYEGFHAAYSVTSPVRQEVVYSGARWNGGPPPGQISHAAGQVIQPVPVTPPRPGLVQAVHAGGVPAGAPVGQVGASPVAPRPQAPPPPSGQPQPNVSHGVPAPPPGAAPGAAYGRTEAHWGRPPSPPRMESNSPDHSAAPPPVAAPPAAQPHWGRGVQAPPPGGSPGPAGGGSEAHWGQPPAPPRVESRAQVGPPPAASYGGGAPHQMAPPPAPHAPSNQGMHSGPPAGAPPPAPHAPSNGGGGAPQSHGAGAVGAPPPGHPHH